jgi:hypothetical protein
MSIPICPYPMNNAFTRTYSINSDYRPFLRIIKNLIECDCLALTITRETHETFEIVFNSYPDKPMRDSILDHIIRNEIIEHTHSSFIVKLNRSPLPLSFDIYLNRNNPWRCHAQYNPDAESYTISFFAQIENYDYEVTEASFLE